MSKMASEGKKLVKSKSGYRMIPVTEAQTSPFTLSEPHWVPDGQCEKCVQCQGKFDFLNRRCEKCVQCQGKFDFLNRRHHCRRCGKCFCDSCCASKVLLYRMLFVDPVRHCAGCSNVSKKEQDFFEKHVKNLTTGGTFHVTKTGETTDNSQLVCRLAVDHRCLQFENQFKRLDDIMLTDIESLQILTAETDSDGNSMASGLSMRYKDSCGEMQVIKMIVTSSNDKRQGQYWVASMQKAFKMIYDSRKP